LLHFSAFYGFNFTAALLLHQILIQNSPGRMGAENGGNQQFDLDEFGKVTDYDGNGETALHVATKRGQLEVVSTLIKGGADINARTRDSLHITPLHLAVIEGHDEVIKVLLQCTADVDCRGSYLGE